MTHGGRLVVRALFAAVVLSLPVMIVLREQVGEPYPGLYQPAFDGAEMRGDRFTRQEPVVVFRDAAGRSRRIAVTDLVDAPALDDDFVTSMLRTALRDRTRMRGPDAVARLRAVAAEHGIADPVRVRVTWWNTARPPGRLDGATRVSVHQAYTIRLDR